jgi:hypothetical protein
MSDAAYKSKRQRSPSYPGIGLEAALERARSLYGEEGRNAAPNDAILQHWGYAPRSGPGLVTIAALKRFGLLVSEGSGKSRLSNLALSIILDEREDSPERDEAIKQAALMPRIHKELWDKYQWQLPSDATLRHFLRLDKGFTDSAADELIRQFRETISFAQLAPGDSLSGNGPDSEEGQGGSPLVTELLTSQKSGLGKTRGDGTGQRSVPIPLSATEWVTLQGPFPISEQSWEQLKRVLDVMRPGLVSSPDEATDEDAD